MDDYKAYFNVLTALAGFVLAQIFNYIQLKLEHKQMLKSINGIGTKVSELTKEQSKTCERVAKIEGYIQASSLK